MCRYSCSPARVHVSLRSTKYSVRLECEASQARLVGSKASAKGERGYERESTVLPAHPSILYVWRRPRLHTVCLRPSTATAMATSTYCPGDERRAPLLARARETSPEGSSPGYCSPFGLSPLYDKEKRGALSLSEPARLARPFPRSGLPTQSRILYGSVADKVPNSFNNSSNNSSMRICVYAYMRICTTSSFVLFSLLFSSLSFSLLFFSTKVNAPSLSPLLLHFFSASSRSPSLGPAQLGSSDRRTCLLSSECHTRTDKWMDRKSNIQVHTFTTYDATCSM